MRKIFLLLSVLLISSLYAQQVDRDELLQVKKGSVEFLNYEGPHAKFDTKEEIIAIGTYLGGGEGRNYLGRYSVIHVFDPLEDGKRNADIFIIHKSARIDHVRNLRFIIAGYIESVYGYVREDALLLAEFVTYYNAVFRGRVEYFTDNYKPAVISHLEEESIGLSTKYNEWPGRSQIVIPLASAVSGDGPGILDSDELADEEVIEDLRDDEDLGIEPRKEITELREREIEEEQRRIEEEKTDVAAEEERIAVEREKIEEEREELSETGSSPEGTAESGELDRREAETDAAEEEVEKRKEEIEEREETLSERQGSVDEERARIAEDERTRAETESPAAGTVPEKEKTETVPFLFVSDSDDGFMGSLMLIDSETAEVDTESALNTIRGRGFSVMDNSIIAVAGIDDGVRAVRLVKINSSSLDVSTQGNEDIYPDTVVKINGSSIYAVMKSDNKWHLGKFDGDLKLLAVSEISVVPYTAVVISGNSVYVQNDRGSAVVLSLEDLTEE